MPSGLRRLLHRTFNQFADSWYAKRQTGGRTLCTID